MPCYMSRINWVPHMRWQVRVNEQVTHAVAASWSARPIARLIVAQILVPCHGKSDDNDDKWPWVVYYADAGAAHAACCLLLLTGSRIITKGARQTPSEQAAWTSIPKPRLEWEAVADTMERTWWRGRGGLEVWQWQRGGRMRMTPFPIKNTHTL